MKSISKKTLRTIGALCTISILTMSASCGSSSPETASAGETTFSSSSFWYEKIPENVRLHVNSGNYVTEFLRQLASYYQTVNINTNTFSAPVYLADAATPKVAVTEWDCQGRDFSNSGLAQQWSAVPIPATALPSNDSDAEMVIYQPSTDTLWEFWGARKVNGSWQGCWGGRLQNASRSTGIWPDSYGATATGLPLMGGMITAEELQAGAINHAMGIALVDLENNTIFSWPAVRSDGGNPGNAPNRIPEGLRFRLDPTVNLDTLNLTPAGKIIAKAAQIYGFVVWDKAGAISLRAKDPKSYTRLGQPDLYPALFNNLETYAILKNFPWDRLQFLPMNYGKGE